jgi:hypothetical protein
MSNDNDVASMAERHAQLMREGETIARRVVAFIVLAWLMICAAIGYWAFSLWKG